jgi:hypothetical protein
MRGYGIAALPLVEVQGPVSVSPGVLVGHPMDIVCDGLISPTPAQGFETCLVSTNGTVLDDGEDVPADTPTRSSERMTAAPFISYSGGNPDPGKPREDAMDCCRIVRDSVAATVLSGVYCLLRSGGGRWRNPRCHRWDSPLKTRFAPGLPRLWEGQGVLAPGVRRGEVENDTAVVASPHYGTEQRCMAAARPPAGLRTAISRENTGNFIDFGLGCPNLSSKQRL